jgi:hypothetical protein
MSSGWIDHRLAKEYVNERLRQAEQWRLAEQALAANRPTDPPYRRVLRWLGYQLAAWGTRLQKRYAEPCCPLQLDMELDMESVKR